MAETISDKPISREKVMSNEMGYLMDYVYRYATVPLYTDPLHVEVPDFIAKGMWLTEIKVKDGVAREGYCFVDVMKLQDALFRQGHVSQVITMLAYLEKRCSGSQKTIWRQQRKCLTMALMEFTKREIPSTSNLFSGTQVERIINGNADVQSFAAAMGIWLRLPENVAERKMLQYILPLFLFLGDFTEIPDRKRILTAMRYVIVGSISHLGANTWRGTFYDDSYSTKLFPCIVQEADKLFTASRRRMKINNVLVQFLTFTTGEKKALPRLLTQAGNWLSLGAYITLVSKYARYSLPNASGKMEVADLFKSEQAKYYSELTSKLEQL